EGRWLRVNRAICEMVGYSEAELLVIDFQTVTHPDDLDADLAYVQAMLAGEIPTYQMEKRYFHKNGSTVWVVNRRANGTPYRRAKG
ncbi:PAS domain S-box protein, partial [Acinetobacter baumannii]